MELTQKEASLLKDLKNEEKLCIEKYTQHSSAAKDSQLKNLFSQIAQIEKGHLDTLSQIENGTTPSGSGSPVTPPSFTQTYQAGETDEKKSDCYLCTDLLDTEKHASSLYNTCIFEFTDDNVRTALNHIQKEEQEHGKMIYDYMSKNNMNA